MKKRLARKKMKQLSSQQRIQNERHITDVLSSMKRLTVKDIEFSDGYFLMDFGISSVGYFNIEETPDWRYGIWLDREGEGYQIFGEHRLLIDKFKPSRTYLSYYSASSLQDHVLKIIERPVLYFADAYHSGDLLEPYEHSEFFGLSDDEIELVAQQVYKEEMEEEQEEIRFNEEARAYAMQLFQDIANKEHVLEVAISDKMKLWGGLVSPRYDVFIKPTDDATPQQIQALYDAHERMEYDMAYEDKKRGHFFHRHDFRLQHFYRSFDKSDQKKITQYFYHQNS